MRSLGGAFFMTWPDGILGMLQTIIKKYGRLLPGEPERRFLFLNFRGKRVIGTLLCGALLLTMAGCQRMPANAVMEKASIAENDSDERKKFDEIYDILKNEWYYGSSEENVDELLIEQALSGMVSFDEDIHTNYLPKEQATIYSEKLAGNGKGFGVLLMKRDAGQAPTVRGVYIESPAEKAGLLPGDKILGIDDIDATAVPLDDLISYIQSNTDRPLSVRLERDGQPIEASIQADTFDATVLFEQNDNYGVITLSSFSENSGEDVVEALRRLQESGVRNLVIDLSGNSGGYLKAVKQIASALLPDGSVVFREKLKDGTENVVKTDKSDVKAEFDHIYILQDGNSASASEVLIGALKDYMPDTVTTIGQKTYGKGTEQINKMFDDGTTLKYTVAEWLTPEGRSCNLTGFEPDVPVELEEYETVSYLPMNEGDEPIQPDTVADNAAPVQIYLRYLGYPADRSDTYFSPQSSEALRMFQADHGLEQTGAVDVQTFNALIEAMSKKVAEETESSGSKAYRKAVELIEQSAGSAPAAEGTSEAASAETAE